MRVLLLLLTAETLSVLVFHCLYKDPIQQTAFLMQGRNGDYLQNNGHVFSLTTFPTTAVTYDHKLSDLFIILHSLWRLYCRICPHAFSSFSKLPAFLCSWPHSPSSNSVTKTQLYAQCHLSGSDASLPFIDTDPCDFIGLTLTIQGGPSKS